MKPGHIRVFDGLRITTEHVEHLQGALHSAVEDLRAIVGLGKVHRGFEVIAAGAGRVVVRPGLGFDRQGNRIVADQPITIEVAFAPGEAEAIVYLKYDQVEGGQVEGRYTLVWDSCTAVLRPPPPAPNDNELAVARLTQTEDGVLTVTDLTAPSPAPAAEPPTPPAAEAPPAPAPPSPPEEEGAPAESESERTEAAAEEAAATEPEEAPEAVPTPDPPGAAAAPAPTVRQGVARLASEPGGTALAPLLGEPLARLLAAGDGATTGDLRFTVAEYEVAVDVAVASLTCQTALSGTVAFAGAARPAAEPAGAVSGAPTDATRHWLVAAHGEASFGGTDVAQFGLSQVQDNASTGEAAPGSAALTEQGIAQLPLGDPTSAEAGDGTTQTILDRLQLLVRVERGTGSGFTIVCHLLWKGGATAATVQAIEAEQPTFAWEAAVGWKVLGVSNA